MKIIQLGNIDVQFACPHCKTIWQINTSELDVDENGCYFVECPLCDEKIILKDNYKLIEFLKKRKKLETHEE